MANQLFTVAGITTIGTSTKVRFTEDMIRQVKKFMKMGATRCDFVNLPEPMTKMEALKFLTTHPDFSSPADQYTISENMFEREKKLQRIQRELNGEIKRRKPRTPKVKVEKPSLESIRKLVTKTPSTENTTQSVDQQELA